MMRQRHPSNPCSLFQATIQRPCTTKKIGAFPVERADLGPAHLLSSFVGMYPDSLPPISPVLALTYRSGTLYPKPSFFRTKVSVFLVSLEAGIG